MNINNLGLLNTLSSIINDEEDSSDKAISKYLLTNLNQMDLLTINEIVDEAYVSHSSVRRFCNRLGYKNFSELKNSFSDIVFPSNLHLRKFDPVHLYRENITAELTNIINGINQMNDDQMIQNIVDSIHNHAEVSLMSANNTTSNLLKFQQELFYANKIVRIVNNNYEDRNLSEVLNQSDLTIIVSISGVFAEGINQVIQNNTIKKILVTANRNPDFKAFYDEIYYLSENDIRSDALGLLGKYGTTYFFDLISEHYIYKYKSI